MTYKPHEGNTIRPDATLGTTHFWLQIVICTFQLDKSREAVGPCFRECRSEFCNSMSLQTFAVSHVTYSVSRTIRKLTFRPPQWKCGTNKMFSKVHFISCNASQLGPHSVQCLLNYVQHITIIALYPTFITIFEEKKCISITKLSLLRSKTQLSSTSKSAIQRLPQHNY